MKNFDDKFVDIIAYGGTDITKALKETYEWLDEHGSSMGDNQIILITDGHPNDSFTAKDEAIRVYENSSVTITLVNFMFTELSKVYVKGVMETVSVHQVDKLGTVLSQVASESKEFK